MTAVWTVEYNDETCKYEVYTYPHAAEVAAASHPGAHVSEEEA